MRKHIWERIGKGSTLFMLVGLGLLPQLALAAQTITVRTTLPLDWARSSVSNDAILVCIS